MTKRRPTFPIIPPVPASGEGRSWRDMLVQIDGHAGPWPERLDPRDGVRRVESRAAFEAIAQRDDVPGAIGVREVKFLIMGVDTDAPQIYFMNAANRPMHYTFARDVLGVRLDAAAFNRITYFNEGRSILAGSVIAHDSFIGETGAGLYSLVFWPSDIVRAPTVEIAHRLIVEAMPFVAPQLAYQPGGMGQQELAAREAAAYARAGIRVVTTDEVFAQVSYNPMNLGVAFGRLVIVAPDSDRAPQAADIPIFQQLPNDLARVAGVLTEAPQTPLAHVNLRAQQNGIPNAFLRDAATNPQIAPLIGQIVRMEVGPDAITIRAATETEMTAHLDSLRPTEVQVPERDLSQTNIVSLDALGHADHVAYGAKAANLAELRKILEPGRVPAGYGVPFAYYARFMEVTGLGAEIAAQIAEESFAADAEVRREVLKGIRKAIRGAEMPADLAATLDDMHQRFPPGTTPRCRSSANAEDVPGFSGAGLYNSYTHHLDEGHIAKSIKQVWASLWTFRAFEEREFHRVDHMACAMGVLVHPNFEEEQANGVAVTHNPYFANFAGYYVNVQVGEDRVTNPVDAAVAEELLVMSNAGLQTLHPFVTMRIRESNLVPDGTAVMRLADVTILIEQLEIVQSHFRRVYDAGRYDGFAMEVEFKVNRDGIVVLKQARPWTGNTA